MAAGRHCSLCVVPLLLPRLLSCWMVVSVADAASAAAEAADMANSTPAVSTVQPQGVAAGQVTGEAADVAVQGAASEAAVAAAANATEQAMLDLAALAAAPGEASAKLRGASGWGHGILGETCCMCSAHVGWNTVLFAAEDYSHFLGGHAAQWWCQRGCEAKCRARGAYKFGCYDEQHLLAMDRLYGHRAGYSILHDQHFGNIC